MALHQKPHSFPTLRLLTSSKQTPNQTPCALDTLGRHIGNVLCRVCKSRRRTIVDALRPRHLRRNISTVIVLSLSLGSIDGLLGSHVADGLQKASLPDLAGREVVHAVLEVVDLLDTRDLCLAKSI